MWITLILCGFLLVLALMAVWRFPEEVRSLVRRTSMITISRQGIAWRIYEEAVEIKEGHEPSAKRLKPLMRRLGSGRLLWVDDAPANNRLEVQALRELGLEIDTASSNAEAVSYARSRPYDLVLSDIGRAGPEEDVRAGLALPAELKAIGSTAPVAYYVGEAEGPQTETGEPVFDTPSGLLAHVAATLGQSK